jgi:hypothetical protein
MPPADRLHPLVIPLEELDPSPHGVTNTVLRELRLTAIHGGSRFVTEWLAGDDQTWRSKAR